MGPSPEKVRRRLPSVIRQSLMVRSRPLFRTIIPSRVGLTGVDGFIMPDEGAKEFGGGGAGPAAAVCGGLGVA